METQPSPMSPPSPMAPPPQPAKKGLGIAAKVGIGCGGLILLIIVGDFSAIPAGQPATDSDASSPPPSNAGK